MEDFSNYKMPSMFVAFPYCTWKCDKECGLQVCQNSALANSPNMDVDVDVVVKKYLDNPITRAVVCGGLEPFDSWLDLLQFVTKLREQTKDDIVVYTGYNMAEIADKIDVLKEYDNIIVKFGRYKPHQENRYDDVLGVYLASGNQYAEVISNRGN